jgi:hypothetical protein
VKYYRANRDNNQTDCDNHSSSTPGSNATSAGL